MARAKKETAKVVEQQAEIQQQQAAAQEQQPVPQLTLQDLTLAANIINVVTARGAIKAEEMSVVGALYDKLSTFLTAHGITRTPAQKSEGNTEAQPA